MPNLNQNTLNFDAINKVCLRFKKPNLERKYQQKTEPMRKLQMRMALLCVGILYGIVSCLDLYTLPDAIQKDVITIHLSQSFAFIGLVLLSLHFSSSIFHSTMVVSSVLVAWLNHLLIINITATHLLFGEAYLMIIWVWLITGLSFRQACMVSLFFIITYELNAIFFLETPLIDMITQHFFVYVSFLFGGLAGYLLEYHKRQTFLNLETVSKQADLLRHINEQLAQDKALLLKFSQAVEQSGEGILIANKTFITEYVNPAYTQITGFKASEIIGQIPTLLQDTTNKEMWQKLNQGKVWCGKGNALKKDGSTYPVWFAITPLKDAQGTINHYVINEMDMTDQHHLENEARQLQKMEAIGTLVGGIAHDFNNTLASITGNIFLAKQDIDHLPKTLEKLDVVEDLSFQAADMINQLLAFSRKGVVSLKPLSLNHFLKDISKLHKITLPKSITFTQTMATTEELIVHADANQLQQVIINLLNNAKDATLDQAKPSISLHLDTYQADENFKNRHPDLQGSHFARICITDNGHGIKAEHQAVIFDPFYTTKDVDKGTGLGLSMAYGTLQSHGGLITVSSQWGHGATFHLYLPLVEAKTPTTTAPLEKQIATGHGETILLVDDDAAVLATGSDILEALGYHILCAEDGVQALSMYEKNQNQIKLVVMDIAMPNMDGIQSAKRMRAVNPDVNIVFVTGFDSSQTLNRTELTTEHVILKPFKISSFSQTIQSMIQAKGKTLNG